MKKFLFNFNFFTFFIYLIFIIFLTPLLILGYAGDDIYNSQILGILIERNQTLFERILEQTYGWIIDSGRLFIFSYPILYLFHIFFNDPIFIRIIEILLILSTSVIFMRIINKISNVEISSSIFIIVLLIHFQFRNWHDPFLIFPSHLVIFLAFFLFLSIYQFILYLENEKNKYLFFSFILFLFSIFIYELAIPFILVFFVYPFVKKISFSRSIFLLKFHIFAVFIYFIIFFIVKFFLHDVSDISYNTFSNFNVIKSATAFYFQLLSSFPLSAITIKSNFNIYIFLCLFVFFNIYFYKFIHSDSIIKKYNFINFKHLIFFGILIFIFPIILVAFSGHRDEIINAGYGYGYSPVYFQYFGSSIFIIIFLIFIFFKICSSKYKFINLIFILSISFIFSLFLSSTYINNMQIIKTVNKIDKLPRSILDNAFSNNLFSELSPNSNLIRIMKKGVDWKWYYFSKTKFEFKICDFLSQDYSNNKDKLLPLSYCLDYSNTINRKGLNYIYPDNLWVTSYFYNKNDGESGAIVTLSKISQVILTENMEVVSFLPEYTHIFDNKDSTIKTIYDPVDVLDLLRNEFLDLDSSSNVDNIYRLVDNNFVYRIKDLLPKEGAINSYLNWVNKDFEIDFFRINNDSDVKINIYSEIINLNKQDFNITISTPKSIENFVIRNDKINELNFSLDLLEGHTSIKIHSNAEIFENGDPRKIKFGLKNFKIVPNN